MERSAARGNNRETLNKEINMGARGAHGPMRNDSVVFILLNIKLVSKRFECVQYMIN